MVVKILEEPKIALYQSCNDVTIILGDPFEKGKQP